METDLMIWAAFALAQLADVLTTNKILSQGGRELNPVVAKLMDTFGGAWPYAKAGGATLAAYVVFSAGYPWGVAVIAGLTGAVAINNYRQIK